MIRRHALIVTALMVALAGALHATSAVKLDLETMAEKATVILVAKVDSKQAKWDAGKKGIWTHHKLTVSETLKGQHQKEREFVTRGGVVGRVGQHVSGSGHFDVGQEYVLFLWKDDDDRLRLVGMVQGAFEVYDDGDTKKAKNSTAGLTIVNPETLKPVKDKGSPLDYTLEVLKTEVKEAVKEEE